MTSPRLFAALLALSLSAVAQPPFGGAPVATASHIHLNSANPETAIAFWTDTLGANASRRGSFDSISTLGVTILFSKQAPTGPSAGTAIDHLALKVPDLQPVTERLAKTSYKSSHPAEGPERLIVEGPDGVRVELIEDNAMYASLEFNHIHLFSNQPKEMRAWYTANLGARPGFGDNTDAIAIPGANLTITQADSTLPTTGRAIDHLSFEVKDLAALCARLAANGIKLDSPPHSLPELDASAALLTDPWGTHIELLQKNTH